MPEAPRTGGARAAESGLLLRAGTALLAVGLLTSTWNAVRIGGVPPSDTALLGGLLLLVSRAVVGGSLPALRASVVVGAALVALSGVLTSVRGLDAEHYEGRYVQLGGQAVHLAPALSDHPVLLAKFLVSLLAVPYVVLLLPPTRRRLRSVAAWWAASSVASCAVALLDELGATAVSPALLGRIDLTGRQSGLTSQPNHLAVAAALTVPLLVYWALRGSGRSRWAATAALPVLLGGLVVSGSRGGLAAAVLAAVVSTLHVVRHRPHVVLSALSAGLLLLAGALHQAETLLLRLRLVGETATRSDHERQALLVQGLEDFAHRPLHGIGFGVINSAHEVHVQLLAAGGLLALAGFLVHSAGVCASVRSAVRVDPLLGSACAVAFGTWLLLGLVENQLVDRYLYVPAALLLALAAAAPAPSRGAPAVAVGGRGA